MPGAARYQKMSREITNAVHLGSLSVTWKEEGKFFEYARDGKRYRYDIAAGLAIDLGPDKADAPARTNRVAKPAEGRRETGRSGPPARGRQFSSTVSPDGKFK